MDDVFLNFPQIRDYFEPRSYLDIGANKGQTIEFICSQFPFLSYVEMIEASKQHEPDLKAVSERTNFPYHIEVLSDTVKTVNFYLDVDPNRPTAPGNSYYAEDTHHNKNFLVEERVTKTLDGMYPNRSFDVIKLDTQGSELDIIKGGMSLIARAKALVIEENIVPFNVGAPLSHEIRSFLAENGFTFVKHLKWWGGMIQDANGQPKWHEEVDSLYIRDDILENLPPLPISVGILSWKSDKSLQNALESYVSNGLFKIVSNVTILFQESREEDKKLAREFNIPYIAMNDNVGIGNAFVTLSEQSSNEYVLLLEDDWELIENYVITRERLKSAIDMIQTGTNVVRLRHRKKPGFPLHSRDAYEGRELEKFDDVTDLVSPHLFESIHWISDPEIKFNGMIFKENSHYITSSRWSNFSNNPCLYKREFYIDTVSPFKDKGLHLEPDISYWWARQKFKVAWGEGLFSHNDIDKYY